MTRRLALALLAACGTGAPPAAARDVVAIERAAVRAVFLTYEHPAQLVFWDGEPRESPILGEVPLGDSLRPRGIAPAELALPVPVSTITQAELDRHFRRHADAWDAWYAQHPASGGIIELTAPRFSGAGRAAVVVGRLCGEHCRSAWRVVVERSGDGAWRVAGITPVPLPLL